MNDAQRAALNLVEIDGEPHLNHWYVLIAARQNAARQNAARQNAARKNAVRQNAARREES
ncbi:MAG: hypothetical protein KKB13_21410 [Chloroflexi bacterium]|nr:hypothetical protein [Chloroflexota bacterium]